MMAGCIVMSNHLFGNTYSLVTTTLARLDVKAQIADFSDLDLLDKTIADDACLIFAEYITNPQLEMVDIKKLSTPETIRCHAHHRPRD